MNNKFLKLIVTTNIFIMLTLGAVAQELEPTKLSPEASAKFHKLVKQFDEYEYSESSGESFVEYYEDKESEQEPLAAPAPSFKKPEKNSTKKMPIVEAPVVSSDEIFSEVIETDKPDEVTNRRNSGFIKKTFVTLLLSICVGCVIYILLAIYKNYILKEKIFDEKLAIKDDNSLHTPDSVEAAIKLFLRKMK